MQARKSVNSEAAGNAIPASQPQPDRRRDVRHLTILRVGTVHVDGRRELCLVRNISAGGLMAIVYSDFEVGDRIQIELKTNQPIPGTVTWKGDSTVGVEFDEKIDIAEILSNPPLLENGWRPRMPRVPIDRLATLRAGARTYWVSTRDISQGGVKVEADHTIDIGAETIVMLENFRPIPGVVRWRKGNVAGISFNQVIPFHELTRWLVQDMGGQD